AEKKAKKREDSDVRDKENAQKRARRAEDGEYRDALQVRDVNRKRTAYNILIFLTSPARHFAARLANISAESVSFYLREPSSRGALAGAKRRLV
ncbi:hypothetical protein THAOC_29948, partial [Thalassiosira oceanica]